jgi:CubicO group peptidase (beta-lactamase class C family)
MKTAHCVCFLFLMQPFLLFSQKNMEDYSGGWRGQLAADHSLAITLDIEILANQTLDVTVLHKNKKIRQQNLSLAPDQHFQAELAEDILLSGRYLPSEKKLDGFIQTMFFQYYVSFSPDDQGHFTAVWKPWIVEQLQPSTIYLAVENGSGDQYEAYPFFDEARFPGTFAANFQKKENEIHFIDIKSGLSFRGQLKDKKIELALFLGNHLLVETALFPFEARFPQGHDYPIPDAAYQKPQQIEDGLLVGALSRTEVDLQRLERMADSINAQKLTHTHSVLIAKNNQLVYEKYFHGYDRGIPHDTRSAQKSISSAMLGITIRDGLIKNEQQLLYDFIPKRYHYTQQEAPLKSKIKLQDVLTMSSGLDAIDYGLDRQSAASEGAYQSTPDWTQTILEAPMINSPGKEGNYGSGNPHLIGVVVNEVIDQSLNFYMNDKLLAPLQIKDYILQNDHSRTPYFGGGMYLSSRSLMKFGMLYLNEGRWNGQRILSKNWIKKSFKKHSFLANDSDKNEYGYFWWHDTYEVGGQKIASIEARGAGGQYIFVVPEYDMVVVITSGNYRNGRFWQPELIMEEYILPAFVR